MEKTGNVNHNHCMRADPQDPLPFCYTTDLLVRYEHCDCDDNQIDSNYPESSVANWGFSYGNNGYGPYGVPGPYGRNPGYLAAHKCTVSRTIKGIVTIGSNEQPTSIDYRL